MNPDTKALILDAVNTLITSPDAHELYASMEAVAAMAQRHPVRLIGDAAVLNPLVSLRLREPEAYPRVLELVEVRRAALGYDALVRKATPDRQRKEKKNKYMSAFMDQKRERQRVAAEIENLARPDEDKLVGNARLEFMRRQSARWKEQRDAFMEKASLASGGALTKELIQKATAQFWGAVDADLEAKRKAAVAESLLPTNKRAAKNVALASLIETLEFDPYQQP